MVSYPWQVQPEFQYDPLYPKSCLNFADKSSFTFFYLDRQYQRIGLLDWIPYLDRQSHFCRPWSIRVILRQLPSESRLWNYDSVCNMTKEFSRGLWFAKSWTLVEIAPWTSPFLCACPPTWCYVERCLLRFPAGLMLLCEICGRLLGMMWSLMFSYNAWCKM